MTTDPETDGGTAVSEEPDPGPAGGQFGDIYRALRDHEFSTVIGSGLFLVFFPFLLVDGLEIVNDLLGDPGIGGYEGLASLVLIYGIIVVGYNLLLGYTGLLSFGHAAFFGTAAYATALLGSTAEITFYGLSATMPGITSPLLMILFGTVMATALAWPIGFMSIRRSGVYFAVLTLTFGQMLYFFALGPGAGITNGDNGFRDFDVGNLLGVVDLGGTVPFIGTVEYAFVALLFLFALGSAIRIVNSPYGLIFKALGENEQRVEFVGLNVFRYKHMAFIISGGYAGAGGALFVMHESFIHPNTALYWIQSGDFVIMTVLGGTGTLIGPVFGAFIFEYISNVISGATLPFIGQVGSLWRLILGAVFVTIVWVFPRGVYGGLLDIKNTAVPLAIWAIRNPREVPGAVRDWLARLPARVAGWVRGLLARFGLGGGD